MGIHVSIYCPVMYENMADCKYIYFDTFMFDYTFKYHTNMSKCDKNNFLFCIMNHFWAYNTKQLLHCTNLLQYHVIKEHIENRFIITLHTN